MLTSNRKAKTISSTEAKAKFNAVVTVVANEGASIVIETHGEPKAVLVPYAEYRETQEMKDKIKRIEAFERLERVRKEVSARVNQAGVSEEQRDQIAVQFSRDLVSEMAHEGKVNFERQQQ